ncbi:hypothetical protein GCM10023116_42160 [Kistimonas scapharcae]|uniref:Uncharacterized protein n=1 Tax=Kistimonas scapharcae TaxID=1036133 RepID=A0ABP8VAE6_9GAMM
MPIIKILAISEGEQDISAQTVVKYRRPERMVASPGVRDLKRETDHRAIVLAQAAVFQYDCHAIIEPLQHGVLLNQDRHK